MKWGEMELTKQQCKNKILEIVFPDSLMTENALTALKTFQADWAKKESKLYTR